jgi:hypothetical protein
MIGFAVKDLGMDFAQDHFALAARMALLQARV